VVFRLFTLDFETASKADLKMVGSWRYAEDPTTEILCLCGALQDWKLEWTPANDGDERFYDLQTLARDPEVIFVSHGTQFEKAIWRTKMVGSYGFPDVPDTRWIDTMASCALKGIPLGLDEASKVLQLDVRKDVEGRKITLAASKSDKPRDIARIIQYCHTDVLAEIELHGRVGNLPKEERRIWLMDQTINQRGVKVDLEFVRACQRVVKKALRPLLKEFLDVTGLKPTQTQKVREWLSTNGLSIPNLKAGTIEEYLDDAFATFAFEDLDPKVKRVLEIRQLTAGAAVKKLNRMEAMVCSDGRARGLLQYRGAGTGRWAGRLLQPQNFPRGTVYTDIDTKVNAIMGGDLERLEQIGEPISVVTSSLRHALVADCDRTFLSGDFSGIEARIILALAGQLDKVDMMASGQDVYLDMAETIYDVPKGTFNKKDHPEQRQDGKNTVLGCGFRMGPETFHKRYCPQRPIEFAERTIKAYREEWAPNVKRVWYDLENAARETVWTKKPHEAYGVRYSIEDEWLVGRRPSDACQYYFHPTPDRQEMPWSKEGSDVRRAWYYWAKKFDKWTKVWMHGGILAENVVQGLAWDLLCDAMLKCGDNGLPVVMTIHDEIVVEPRAGTELKVLTDIMQDRPRWAIDMKVPVAVEGWVGERYRK
jgi:DNA polymerase bacteriophage-type